MKIKDQDNNLLALVIKSNQISTEKDFITENDSEFQLASFNLGSGTEIINHYHPNQERTIKKTSEAIVVLSGKVKVDIFDNNLKLKQSVILNASDTILLIDGGHGITMLEDSKFIEVKQGPYLEDNDKVRF